MNHLSSQSEIASFFKEVYQAMLNSKKIINDPWVKISTIHTFQGLNDYEINQIIHSFHFLKREQWNHVSIDKIKYILDVVKFSSYEIKTLVTNLLDFRGFEHLIGEILNQIGYYTTTNFRFTDHSEYKNETSQERYEIDIVGLQQNLLLIIDAKEWYRRSAFSGISKAANLQYQRGVALKGNPQTLYSLIERLINSSKRRMTYLEKYLPLKLIPIMVTLEENSVRLNERKIPLVSISRINSFLSKLEYREDDFQYYTHLNITERTFHPIKNEML